MRIALYQPDIPQNTAAIIRTAVCFGAPVDLIEPAGFRLDGAAARRAGLDYLDQTEIARHRSWAAFLEAAAARRGHLVLFTTAASMAYTEWPFAAADTLLFGRESAGGPEHVHACADARVTIPMMAGARSLNLAAAAAIGLSEVARQLRC